MFNRRQFVVAGTAMLAISALPALSMAEDAKPVNGGTLTWGVETEPATLNPQLNGQDKTKLLLRNAYESLLARTADGGYVPWLATGYSISEDGKTYTFKLRDDVTFTDGQKFDAQAVVANFEKLKDPAYSTSVSAGPVSRIAGEGCRFPYGIFHPERHLRTLPRLCRGPRNPVAGCIFIGADQVRRA